MLQRTNNVKSSITYGGPEIVAAEPTRTSFQTKRLRLAADRWEPAPRAGRHGAVVLLHGGGQTRHSWRRTGQRLADSGWTAIALDARGHGESDWDSDGDYGIEALVSDLLAVVGGLRERPVLVGASAGGLTSLIAQGERPELARALVLVDVTPRIELDGAAEVTNFMRSGADGFASLDEAAEAVVAYNPHRAQPPGVDGLRKNLRQVGDRWYWHWDPRFLSGASRPGSKSVEAQLLELTARAEAAARAISVPTLLVRGAESRIVSPATAHELRQLIPAARQLDVSGAGHMVAGDDNDVFCGGLLEFLETEVLSSDGARRP
jgi:pimeloyl-ACP methyl ester carboxylesterase